MSDPIVFLPGYLCDPRLYLAQVMALSQDHIVIHAPLRGERCEEMASDLLPHLPARFSLVGASLGGIVALELLRRAPDRISRACLISTDALADAPQVSAAREPLIVQARAGRMQQALQGVLPHDALAATPSQATVRQYFDDMAASFSTADFIAQTRCLQKRRDHQSTLRRITCPVHVVGGAQDTVVGPKRQAFMAELMHNGRFTSIPNAGHLPTLEAPGLMSDLLRDWVVDRDQAA